MADFVTFPENVGIEFSNSVLLDNLNSLLSKSFITASILLKLFTLMITGVHSSIINCSFMIGSVMLLVSFSKGVVLVMDSLTINNNSVCPDNCTLLAYHFLFRVSIM